MLGELRLRGRLYRIVAQPNDSVMIAMEPSVSRLVTIRVRPREKKRDTQREIALLNQAARANPNVPRVLDRAIEGDEEFLVLEHVDGKPLAHWLKRSGPSRKPFFAPQQALSLVRGLALGLRSLHRFKIIHGDLKPENIIVTAAPHSRLRLIDFGISWSGLEASWRLRGRSKFYAAPEQWRDEGLVDERTDQFSLSVVLYEMLTHELPYGKLGGTALDHAQPPQLIAPSRKNPLAPSVMDAVVTRGLALNREQRFPTTDAWTEELSAVLSRVENRISAMALARDTAESLAGGWRTLLSLIRNRRDKRSQQ